MNNCSQIGPRVEAGSERPLEIEKKKEWKVENLFNIALSAIFAHPPSNPSTTRGNLNVDSANRAVDYALANRFPLNPRVLAIFSICREITIPKALPLEDLKIVSQQFPTASLTIPLLLPLVRFYVEDDKNQDVLEKFAERLEYILELSETHQIQVIIQFPEKFSSEEDKKMVVKDLFLGLGGTGRECSLQAILVLYSDNKEIFDNLRQDEQVSYYLKRDLEGDHLWSSEDPSTSETDFSDLSSEDELWIAHMVHDSLGEAGDDQERFFKNGDDSAHR